MKKPEAKQQIETFFRRLGERKTAFFDDKSYIEARVGETLIGFDYDEKEETLSAQALIYRFRSAPPDKVLDAVFAEENETNSGGGRVVFNSETNTFYLQRDFTEKTGDHLFYEAVNRLAQASLRWNAEILAAAAAQAK